jgi:hypothetical protein
VRIVPDARYPVLCMHDPTLVIGLSMEGPDDLVLYQDCPDV